MTSSMMRWPQWKHLKLPLCSLLCISLGFRLFLHTPDRGGDLAVETYSKHYPAGRQLHKYRHTSDYFKAQADEAYQKFKYNLGDSVSAGLEEIEFDQRYKRKIPKPPASRIRPVELQTSLYFMADDGRYDAQQILRCAHDKHFRLNHTSTCAEPETTNHPPLNLTMWTMDYSSGTIADLKFLLEPLGVKFIDKSLSPSCNVFETCSRNIGGIDALSGLFLREDTAERFLSQHDKDPEFSSADIVLCVRPAAMCELYLPLVKNMIILIDTRYEFARWDLERWTTWNANLLKIANNENNVVAATSQYDIEYTRYYTGYGPKLLRPYVGYIKHSYRPTTVNHFLLTPIRLYETSFQKNFMKDFNTYSGLENSSALLTSMNQYRFDQAAETLVQYSGIVLLPYQATSLRMVELYRMNIPLFVPSVELLTNWQVTYKLMTHINWQRIARHMSNNPLQTMPGKLSIPNPNDVQNKGSVGFWLNFALFYSWPHVIRFYSVHDLVVKMRDYTAPRLAEVSRKMAMYNTEVKKVTKAQWLAYLRNFQEKKDRSRSQRQS